MKLDRHGRRWTQKEDDYLSKYVGTKSYDDMAKRLRRTPNAIERRMDTLGIQDKHIETYTFSANQVGQALGKDSKTIVTWIYKRGLKADYNCRTYEKQIKKYRQYFIKPEDVWKWVENHKELIDFRKIERDLLLPEPDWLRDEILNAWDSGIKVSRTKYTEEEDRQIWHMYYSGMMQKDIAKEVGRTRNSIEKRLKRLREKRFAS